jgi:hypothetical protein
MAAKREQRRIVAENVPKAVSPRRAPGPNGVLPRAVYSLKSHPSGRFGTSGSTPVLSGRRLVAVGELARIQTRIRTPQELICRSFSKAPLSRYGKQVQRTSKTCAMPEIKYEIIQKIGVLSSPLCPSDISPKFDNLIVWLVY